MGSFAPDFFFVSQKVIGASQQLLFLRPRHHGTILSQGLATSGTLYVNRLQGIAFIGIILPRLLYATPSSDQPFPSFSIQGASFLSDSSVLHLHESLTHQESCTGASKGHAGEKVGCETIGWSADYGKLAPANSSNSSSAPRMGAS